MNMLQLFLSILLLVSTSFLYTELYTMQNHTGTSTKTVDYHTDDIPALQAQENQVSQTEISQQAAQQQVMNRLKDLPAQSYIVDQSTTTFTPKKSDLFDNNSSSYKNIKAKYYV